MGGRAALLLHWPASDFKGSQLAHEGRVIWGKSLIQRHRRSAQSSDLTFWNFSLIAKFPSLKARIPPVAALSNCKSLHSPIRVGRSCKARIFCCSESVPESTLSYDEASSEISPELVVSTPTSVLSSSLNTQTYYTEVENEVFRTLESIEANAFPASATPESGTASTWLEQDKASAGTLHDSVDTRERSCDEPMTPAVAAAMVAPGVVDVLTLSDGDQLSLSNSQPDQEQEIDSVAFFEDIEHPDSGAALLGTDDGNQSLFDQMREILVFAGPALGIWLSGPLMSIIDTAVIGNSSTLELAALGPGTVLCDQVGYVFMFLSIATSNLIATALAHKDETEAAEHLSRLLFVSLFCGVGMMVVTELFATPVLQAFVGVKNYSMIPAARVYVQIRALAWPIVLVGMVAQSASLGMRDSMAPLKVLAIASSVNLFGDILLCTFLGYGIAGAAWATTASQYIGGILMLKSLGEKGYNPLAISVPTLRDFVNMVKLAGPILLTMLSKVSFYTLITYLATSLGAVTLGAHQVMVGIFSLCTVWGEPLSQTAQSFMPGLMYGPKRNLNQARSLLRTLIIIGAIIGVTLASLAVSVPWIFPHLFTKDSAIINQMRAVTIPFIISIVMTPPTLSCEGTLLAGRDMKFLGYSMASCFCGGGALLLLFNKLQVGLSGSWWTLVAFQTTRFVQSYARLNSSKSVLADVPSPSMDSTIHVKSA